MNFRMLRSFQGAVSCLGKRFTALQNWRIAESRGIHQICSQFSKTLTATTNLDFFKPMIFLKPILPQFMQVCGMKQRGHLQLRCKGCYFVRRQSRLYVMCKLKPRHKQMQMVKSFKKTRILTFAHQKKIREW